MSRPGVLTIVRFLGHICEAFTVPRNRSSSAPDWGLTDELGVRVVTASPLGEAAGCCALTRHGRPGRFTWRLFTSCV